MHSIRSGTHQPYPGKLTDTDPISSKLPLIGQLNPSVQERFALSQGRSVAGFGSVSEAYQRDRRDEYVEQIETDDDVLGSGIFDRSGARGTIHSNLGVFADHPSLPGYIAREMDFAVSRDISDITSGAEVVAVPGGGMAYVERGGQLVGPLRPDDRYNPYVEIRMGIERRTVPFGPAYYPGPSSTAVAPAFPDGGTQFVPAVPEEVPLTPNLPAQTAPAIPQVDMGPTPLLPPQTAPTSAQVDLAPTPVLPPVATPASGYGADEEPKPAGWGTYAFAGALVGIAAAIFVGTLTMKPKRAMRRNRRRR